MSRASKLGLGTVQWGLDYGISNQYGQTPLPEILSLLKAARDKGIAILDTAPAYGDAELAMGQAGVDGFRVVTKTLPVRALGGVTVSDVDKIHETFNTSLEKMGVAAVYGLLVHHADNLLAPGGERVWNLLQELQSLNKAEKIGVSVYRPEQMERILESFPVDLVQLPFNLYDQRFARTGLLRQLAQAGVEIHARSAFLQGLLLMEAERLPVPFDAIREHHGRLHQACRDAGLSMLAASLRFCLEEKDIHTVVVGAENMTQFTEILDAVESDTALPASLDDFAVEDISIINPSLWPK